MAQQTNTEIILNIDDVSYSLDTQGIETIPLTFNVSNIKDLASTKGSFSKTIKVPNTTNNINIFNDITNLNIESSFDVSKRNRVYILINSTLVFEGYFQLRAFSVNLSKQEQSLQILVSGDNNDFYNVIGEQYIADDNYNELNHVWNSANIKASWNSSWIDGYYYPLIDYGYNWSLEDIGGATGSVKQNQIFTSTYALYIWNKIFTQAGFTWESSELENLIGNLVIPTNTRSIPQPPDFVDKNRFIAGFGYTGGQGFYTANDLYGTGTYNITSPPPQPLTWYGSSEYIVDRVKFDNESAPFGDPNNLWDTTHYEYTNTSSAPINMKFAFNINLVQRARYSPALPPSFILRRSTINGTGTSSIGYITKISDSYSGMTLPVMSLDGTLPTWQNLNVASQNTVQAPQWKLEQPAQPFDVYGMSPSVSTDTYGPWDVFGDSGGNEEWYSCKWNSPSMLIYPGEKVWLEFAYEVSGDIIANPHGIHPSTAYIPAGTLMATITKDSYMANIPNSEIGPGVEVIYNSTLPVKVKKRDFILSIVKMFNLVIEPDKVNAKNLKIYTTDNYYNSGVSKDWSMKLDTNVDLEGNLLADTQEKKIILKYKDDKDYLNTDYLSLTKLSYGEKQFDVDNEFSIGEKVIELVFSPTPLASISANNAASNTSAPFTSIVLPKIYTVNNGVYQNTESNIRILQKNIIPLTSGASWRLDGDAYSTGPNILSYPYAGHYNHPFIPTSDINFDQVKGLYYPQNNYTNNTLYNSYWRRTLDEVSDSDSKILTADFFLNEKDISDFRFNDRIFLDTGDGGQYYRVNSIMSYNPANITTTKVELIKVKTITIPSATSSNNNVIVNGDGDIKGGLLGSGYNSNGGYGNTQLGGGISIGNGSSTNNTNGGGTVVVGDSSSVQGSNIISVGNNNNIKGKTNVSFGDDNGVAPYTENNMIVGKSNSIGNNNSGNLIIGSGNKIIAGTYEPSNNNVVFGNDINVSGSNQFIIDGMSLQSTSNAVVAGYGELLSPFNDNNPQNYISAGRDEVLNLGSTTTINFVSGGRYE